MSKVKARNIIFMTICEVTNMEYKESLALQGSCSFLNFCYMIRADMASNIVDSMYGHELAKIMIQVSVIFGFSIEVMANYVLEFFQDELFVKFGENVRKLAHYSTFVD